jgi:hypothetical protein
MERKEAVKVLNFFDTPPASAGTLCASLLEFAEELHYDAQALGSMSPGKVFHWRRWRIL